MTRSPDRPRTRAAIACGALALLLLPIIGAIARGDVAASPRAVTWTGRTMGTYVHVTIATADSAAAVANTIRIETEKGWVGACFR